MDYMFGAHINIVIYSLKTVYGHSFIMIGMVDCVIVVSAEIDNT